MYVNHVKALYTGYTKKFSKSNNKETYSSSKKDKICNVKESYKTS